MVQQRVVVVGGGVAGLTAARDLVAAGHSVLVLEAATQTGGKLRRADLAGIGVDVGAEAMLNRRPEGVDLARELHLPVEHPAVVSSRIWTRGSLRALPRSLMGVPLDLDALARSGVLSEEGLARVRREPDLPADEDLADPGSDITVGVLVDRRFGPEVTDRLVEPLLGGVYAGRSRELSARAAVPQLVALAGRGSVLAQASGVPTTYAGPVFAGVRGGMSRLTDALATGIPGLTVRTGTTVRGVSRTPTGFALVVGPASAPGQLLADGVVLATPASATARLLGDLAPVAAAELAQVQSASTAVVSLAMRAVDVEVDSLLGISSGFLVPPVDGRRIKAATFSSTKWAWVREAGRGAAGATGDDVLVLRTSVGRHREEVTLQASDDELVAASLAELAAATGLRSRPVDSHVQRWGGALPQYALGHLDRVVRVRAAVAAVPGLAVCGSAYDGVGIPAVVASAHRAAAEVVRGMMEP